ncbi:MAG: porin, partial [Burkholderiales bacterium]
GWNKSRTSRNGVVGNDQNRTAWTIPVRYNWGKHNIYAHYTRARDDKATAGVEDGARMWAFAYVYDLSKRTSAGVGYGRIRNDSTSNAAGAVVGGGTYNFFTTEGALGSGPRLAAGEDPRMLSFTIRHAF